MANPSIRRPARPLISVRRIAFTIAKNSSGVATALISWMTSLPSSPSGAARAAQQRPDDPADHHADDDLQVERDAGAPVFGGGGFGHFGRRRVPWNGNS